MDKKFKLEKLEQFTDTALEVLNKEFPDLKIDFSDNQILFDASTLDDRIFANLITDLEFLRLNDSVSLENICSRFNNYSPKNRSQRQLLNSSYELLNLPSSIASAGIWVYGNTGIGKTHIATGLAKEFLLKGKKNILYFNANDFEKVRKIKSQLKSEQVCIIDSLDSPYSPTNSTFKEIVLNASQKGGRVFVTSSIPYQEYLKSAFILDPPDKAKYEDMTKGMFKSIEVIGESQRKNNNVWSKSSNSIKRFGLKNLFDRFKIAYNQ